MLREIGLDAEPVVISTRNNGAIIDVYPIDDQFNHTIVRVKIDSEEYLLDGKNAKRPYNLLPVSNLNDKGLVISARENPEWIPLKNTESNKLQTQIDISVQPDGTMNGKLQGTNTGFFAYIFREAFSSESEDDAFSEIVFNEDEKVEVDSVEITQDLRTGLYSYTIEFKKVAESTNDIIYINPIILNAITENPFKKKERRYPIDYDFDFTKVTILNYNIPEGWVVDEAPESKAFKLKDGTMFYRRIVKPSESTVSIRYDFLLDKLQFEPNRYDEIKNLYEIITEVNSEMIVLKRDEE
jgi:hypothetical protein